MTSATWHWVWLLALLSCEACEARRDADPRDLEQIPARGHVSPPIPPHTLSSLGRDSSGRPCLALEPAGVAIRGQLRTEVHSGPPGYGETPSRDERDTIVVIVVRPPVRVCADTAAVAAATPGRSAELDRFQLQLRGASSGLRSHIGETVTAYGALQVRELGAHFTPVILWVDSIPALREPAVAPRQSASE